MYVHRIFGNQNVSQKSINMLHEIHYKNTFFEYNFSEQKKIYLSLHAALGSKKKTWKKEAWNVTPYCVDSQGLS